MSAQKLTITKSKKTTQEDILIDMMKDYPLLRTDSEIYAKVVRDGKICNLSLDSKEFLFFIKSVFKENVGYFPNSTILKDCIDYIKNKGFCCDITEARYRIAPFNNSIIYDLGNGECVNISKNGWFIEKNTYPMFIRNKDQDVQVKPIHSDKGWERLYKYFNFNEDENLLLLTYIVTCFNPNITFPSISINGTNGTGKSTICKFIKKIIDPSIGKIESMSENLNNLRVRLNSCYYSAFDNLDSLPKKHSVFLCKVITGASFTERLFFTNNEIECTHIKASMCLNGLTNFVYTDELADRMLLLNAKLIEDDNRKDENIIKKEFETELPYILGGIFDLLSHALAIVPNVKIQKPTRLADFHRFGYAVAESMGKKGSEFDKVLRKNRERQIEINSDNSIIVGLICDFLKENDGEWCSTMTGLYKSLQEHIKDSEDGKYDIKKFPKAANRLTIELKKHEATLLGKGITFLIKKNGDGDSEISLKTNWIIRTPIIIGRKPIILSNKNNENLKALVESLIGDH